MTTPEVTSTEIKLGEAEFFLNEMKNNLHNPKILSYYVSAFVSAARSVTFFMQKEYSQTHGFGEWHTRQLEKMKQDPIWEFFNKQRIITIHTEPIKSSRKINVYINEPPITLCDSIQASVIRGGNVINNLSPDAQVILSKDSNYQKKIDSDHPTIEKTEGKIIFYFKDKQEVDGIKLCEDYMKN